MQPSVALDLSRLDYSALSVPSGIEQLNRRLEQSYNSYALGGDRWDIVTYKDSVQIPSTALRLLSNVYYYEDLATGKSLLYTRDPSLITDPRSLDVLKQHAAGLERKAGNRMRLVWKDVIASNDPNSPEARLTAMATAAIDDNFKAIAAAYGYDVPQGAQAIFSDSTYEHFRQFPAYIVGYETIEGGERVRHRFADRGAIMVGENAQLLGKLTSQEHVTVDPDALRNGNARLSIAERSVPGSYNQALRILKDELGITASVEPILGIGNKYVNGVRKITLLGYVSADGTKQMLDGTPRILTGTPEKYRLSESISALTNLPQNAASAALLQSTTARQYALEQLSAQFGIPEGSDVHGSYDAKKKEYVVTMAIPPGYRGPAKDVMYDPPLRFSLGAKF